MDNGMELYKKHRPSSFKGVFGQDKAVEQLTDMLKKGALPHTILFSGPSGCGKTTLARILQTKLECAKADFAEMNCADFRGIDSVRSIRQRMNLAPVGGKCRIWLIDEAHQLSKDAQNGFLKILEDTPGHVYFFLCTTEPQKLLRTIVTRCTEIKLTEVKPGEILRLVTRTAKKEGVELPKEAGELIADVSEGSARKALVILHQVIGIADEEEMIAAIQSKDVKGQAIEIARALLNNKTTWKQMAAILQSIDEEPESLRWMILGYCSAILLKSQNVKAYSVLTSFQDNFYDSKKAGLIAACYEVICG